MVSSRQFKTVHDHSLRAEIRLYALYRTLEAVTLLAMIIPYNTAEEPQHNSLLLYALPVCLSYLLVATGFIALAYTRVAAIRQIILGTIFDLIFIGLVAWLAPQTNDVIAPMLMLNVSAAALLVSLPLGLSIAVIAGIGLMLLSPKEWSDHLPYALIYIAIALVACRLGRKISYSDQVTEQQSLEIAELSRMNSLILERLPVGVLVVNDKGRIRTSNEVAQYLLRLNATLSDEEILDLRSPLLARKLQQWVEGKPVDQELLSFRHHEARIEPQFLRLLPQGEEILIFLNDTSQAARRAETMTLATLGRFSASLAHEIRNPLSAINYAAQLLEESKGLDYMDRKMLDIIQQQVRRTNGIINSVLGLAKREPAKPQQFDLCQMVRNFADEYSIGFPLDNDSLTLRIPEETVMAYADPDHVHQILMVLISNARYYGRMPDEPAHMTLRVARESSRCMVDVIDRGPGITEGAARSLFKPFYTTSSHGTGLGLYISRELAQNNRGDLEYLRRGSGSCFRLSIPCPQAQLPPEQSLLASTR
ncbi:PAS domain-containing sensor histidine kinase [Lysobacteraceae bacterium NML07-0707]|nr:PAS domain-containing sensor histidine kinase [Xanthomonadaceae bacterium NML07-0707]